VAERINFTKAALDALKAPPGQRLTVHDAKVAGLQIRVTPSGVKTFSLFRRVKGGNPERVTLGRYPTMTIEVARKRAAQVNTVIETGANPAEVKRALKAEATFADLFADYLERHAKPRKRTWREDKAKYERYLAKTLGPKRLSAIARSDIAAIHSTVSKEGHHVTANRVLALASGVFGWAVKAGTWTTNPAKGVGKNTERPRARFLQASELPRFFSALAAEPNDTLRDYFLLSLLTGARRANVLAMKWREIDFDRGEWHIPRTKNGEPQSVPLTPEAAAILTGRRGDQDDVYVFPGTGKQGHLVEPKSGWRRIMDRDELAQIAVRLNAAGKPLAARDNEALGEKLARARIEATKIKIDPSTIRMADLRIHDLRRTLGSWQARTGASLSIIGKSLNHKSVQTTAIYSRLDTDPVRESIQRATSAMLTAAGIRPAAQVEEVRRRRK
jgi:integrase